MYADWHSSYIFIASVVVIGKNSKWSQWDTQGPGKKRMHERNHKSKISCQTPFKKENAVSPKISVRILICENVQG